MNADSYYEIGHSHEYCQDYAIAETYKNSAYAIVSDGCSGSRSKITDIGARLYCLAARDALRFILDNFQHFEAKSFKLLLESLVIKKLKEMKEYLKLSEDDFDGTLLIAVYGIDTVPTLIAWGDGSFIVTYKDGLKKIINISYEPNMPCYLSYSLDQRKQEAYLKENVSKTITEYLYDPNSLFPTWDKLPNKQTHLVVEPYVDHITNFIMDPTLGVSHITVCSDGIETFQENPRITDNPKVYDIKTIAEEITNYKNINGVFVKRRLNRMKFLHSKKDIVHTDDLAVASIYLGE